MSAFDLATWMTDLGLADQRFGELRVPGTHHSATAYLDGFDPLQSFMAPYRWLGYLLPFIPFIIEAWSRCQYMRVRDQLASGVRYLDLRVAVKAGQAFVAHTMRGLPLEDVLDEIAEFYDRRAVAREVCVVHVRRDDANKAAFDAAAGRTIVLDTLSNHRAANLLTGVPHPFRSPIGLVAGSAAAAAATAPPGPNRSKVGRGGPSTPVILLLEDVLYSGDGPGYPAPRYDNQWFDLNDPAELRSRVDEYLQAPADGLPPPALRVVQNILTPRAAGDIAPAAALCVGTGLLVLLGGCAVLLAVAVAGWRAVLVHPATSVCLGLPTVGLVVAWSVLRPPLTLLQASRRANENFIHHVVERNLPFNVVTVDGIAPAFARGVVAANRKTTDVVEAII